MKTKEEFEKRILAILDQNNNPDYPLFYKTTEEYIYSFFKSKKDSFDKESFYQGLLMIYGWMPTIPFQNKDFTMIGELELSLLREAYNHKDGLYFTKAEIEIIRPSINNSIIGLSKMLHFINKDNYAIWDSRIAKLFGLKHGYQ